MTTPTMIERVARAIFDRLYGLSSDNAWAHYSPHRGAWETAEPRQHAECMKIARAAIEAMREPSEAMTEAGHVVPVDAPPDFKFKDDVHIYQSFLSRPNVVAHYRAMIAAALEE